MELTIDQMPCDLGDAPIRIPGYDADTAADIDACRTGRSLTIELPATPRNDRATRFARDPHGAERFDATLHRAELRAEGALLFEGTVRLLALSEAGYTLQIREGGAAWARQAALRTLDQLGFDLRMRLDTATVCAGWTGSDPVKFFPVARDAWPQRNAPQDLLPDERMLSVDDYRPFLHIRSLAERIFAEAGYTVQSRFFASEFFRSLYMSGAYARRDTAALDARMGFVAGRRDEASATGDDVGRVYADPKALAHTVGNLVDTAVPLTPDANGEPMTGLRNNGGCFDTVDGAVRFTPTAEVDAAFEYTLRYTTDHRILDRTRLRGYDVIYLGPGAEVSCPLANRYADRRAAIAPGHSYLAIVFDHAAEACYRLVYTRNGVAGVQWSDFEGRSARVVVPASGTATDPQLHVRGSDGTWAPYAGDWALYDGHIGETGTTTVTLKVRDTARRCSPSSPARFDLIYFGGAEPGMRLTLHRECRVASSFQAAPGYGTPLAFADVARGGIRQAGLLAALAHLFNLRFHTDRRTRTVTVEPADAFYAGPETDWSDRTDFAHPVERRMLAPSHAEKRTWRYRTGEGAAARLETDEGAAPGSWSYEAPTFAAGEGEQVVPNPLFAASASVAGSYRNAPSALLLSAGDRDDPSDDGSFVTPRIVGYAGLHPLPGGERWGHPWGQASYPLAAFHFAGDDLAEPFTLGFDDRDGAEGLHRFYDRQLEQEATGEEIALWLRIAPHEFEALGNPSPEAPSLRSVFRLDTGDGCVLASLRRIEAYDPEAASVRCLFRRLPEDPEDRGDDGPNALRR